MRPETLRSAGVPGSLFAAALWLALCHAPAAFGAPAFDVAVGFGGVHRTAAWTPIVVTLGGDAPAGGPWHVWVEDPDGQWVRSPAGVESAASGRRSLRFRARFGRPGGAVRVAGPGAAGQMQPVTVSIPAANPGDEPLVLVIGDCEPAERAVRFMAREGGVRPRVIRAARPTELAAGAAGITPRDFDGLDVMVICGSTLEVEDELSREVLAAIDGWVQGGGRLVFLAGESAARAAVSGSVAANWLPGPAGAPGRVDRMVPLRRSAALETFARAARPLDRATLAGLQVPLVAAPARLDGTVLCFEGREAADLPLAVRSVRGFGLVTWLGFDLDRPAFRSWSGTDSLLVELLGGRPAAEAGRTGEAVSRSLDLASQLRSAIDQFSGVAPVPFELIAALGLLYVACLYPLDWWLTARTGRPGLAWVSLPLLVLTFGGLAWETARRWKGSEWRSTTAGIVDVDMVGAGMRGRAWTGVWAPTNATLAVAAAPGGAVTTTGADVAVSWCAATGRGLGGTDAAAPHAALGASDYATADALAALEGVTIAADASRLFEADWTARVSDGAPPAIVASLDRDAQAALRGFIESRLPFPLESCVLVHAGWLYDVGRLAPGGRFEPAAGRGPRSLAGALTRRAAMRERDVAERWDTSSVDVARILEIAGLHEAAGGSGYTAIEAGRLGRLDLSPLLANGRAVLVGRGPAGTDWNTRAVSSAQATSSVPSADQTAVWRFVLPLEPPRP